MATSFLPLIWMSSRWMRYWVLEIHLYSQCYCLFQMSDFSKIYESYIAPLYLLLLQIMVLLLLHAIHMDSILLNLLAFLDQLLQLLHSFIQGLVDCSLPRNLSQAHFPQKKYPQTSQTPSLLIPSLSLLSFSVISIPRCILWRIWIIHTDISSLISILLILRCKNKFKVIRNSEFNIRINIVFKLQIL